MKFNSVFSTFYRTNGIPKKFKITKRSFCNKLDSESGDFSDFENHIPKKRHINPQFESSKIKSLLGKDLPLNDERLKPSKFSDENNAQNENIREGLKGLVDLMNKNSKSEEFSDFEGDGGSDQIMRRQPEIVQNDFHLPDNSKLEEVKKAEEERESSGVYIQSSDILYPKEEYKSQREKEEKESEARFGDYSDNIVRRPKKGFLWGLGTKTFTEEEKSEFFEYRRLPTIKQVMHFLEVHQVRDIKAVDLRNYKSNHLPKFAILGSCFSSRHLHKVGKTLCSEVKKLDCDEIINKPRVMGRKDEPWILISIKEIGVILFLPDVREEIDIEGKWFNEITKEMWDQFNLGKNRSHRS